MLEMWLISRNLNWSRSTLRRGVKWLAPRLLDLNNTNSSSQTWQNAARFSIQKQFYHFPDCVFVCLYIPQRKFESGSYSFKLRFCNASQMRPKLYNFGNLLFELQVHSFNASIQIAYYVLELVTVIYNHWKPIVIVIGGAVGCCIDYIRCREWRQIVPVTTLVFQLLMRHN